MLEPNARRGFHGPLRVQLPARLLLLTVLTIGSVVTAHTQSRPYVGGSVSVVSETRSETIQPAGTTWGGSLLLGLPLSPRVSLEFEPSFIGSLDPGEYTYRPSPSLQAHVTTHRRDTFFTIQFRARTRLLEPVVGGSYVYARARRHATFVPSGSLYFDDRQAQRGVGFAAGLDGSFRLTPRVFVVPTFRAFFIARSTEGFTGEQTSGGPVTFRFGVGTRVTF